MTFNNNLFLIGPNFAIVLFSILYILVCYFIQSLMVTSSRIKNKIPYPLTTGNEVFERVFRAHYNTLENLPLIIPLVAIFGAIINPLLATISGMSWGTLRILYALGYAKSAKDRHPAGGLSSLILLFLLLGSIYGLLVIIYK
jgi:glutathione S-transferase